MRRFDYASPATIDDALALLAGGDGAVRPLAGGTDLLTLMKADIATPERLIDIKRLAELDDAIALDADGLSIGALATLDDLEDDPLVRQLAPALAEAAAAAASPQLRNMATIGGNLLQRPRCWYFRSSLVHCWLKGGTECQARDGENALHALFDQSPCVAVHPSDLATALVALDASVRLRGPAGERSLSLGEFFAPPTDDRRTENVLAPDELILSVRIPPPADNARGTYLKAMDRKVWAFALVGVAATVARDGDRIGAARIVLGGVAQTPWRAREAEDLLVGQRPDADLFARAADAALAGAAPLADNGYKIPLARTLIRRALAAVTADGAPPA
ncbi:MAG: Periplasmic aromatic aldehyde oxidoreductase, FAD binding subunit YagS [uncultured Thermomicrobiales bacterium]|uniref:Periplasmic aromatic aldehyde oxidoreductase, FAD binding subunit YagS n=1 Tax=uncultured Thermomicrobiales bacterium TaxID=1645740 RepID=A0A6J4UCH6_9BACT|nr:MAG: Periplasmic aromatic aldehyde oxidoreductase, FAD binding subunit YagS [uncultured Thermomicrobiales bacterium]